jgi:uncharacterized damage-inducible protein DinB
MAHPGPTVRQLLTLLDEAFRRKSWHGTNLRGSIRGLTAAQAAWCGRPGGRRIVDIVVHCAYWKYAVRRRLRGEKRGSFPLTGSNWLELVDPVTSAAWREYVRLLEEQHRQLIAAVAELSDGALADTPAGRTVSNGMLVRGVALHDVYHTGQIQSLKAARARGNR